MVDRILFDAFTYMNTNFTFGNVAGLSAKPYIHLLADVDELTSIANGEISFDRVREIKPDPMNAYTNENFLIYGFILYFDTTSASDSIIEDMIREFKDVLKTNNNTVTETYIYTPIDMDHESNHNEAYRKFIIEATRLFVK